MKIISKTALVTGAGRGVGAQTAKTLAANGVAVGLLSRTESQLVQVREEILAQGGKAMVLPCDIADENQVGKAVAAMEGQWGPVGILVNNAALFKGGTIEEMSLEDWHIPLKVTLDGTFLCCKYVLPGMKKRGYGRIINIASSAIQHPFKGYGAYATAKSGLIGFGKTLMEEVREFGIHVNTIVLGLTNTDEVKQRSGLDPQKMLQPEDVANTILYLCSEEGRGFKGAALELFGDYL